MFNSIKIYFYKKKLKDKKFHFLFDKAISDEYVCFDCETTGLDPSIDDIISIGAVIIKNNTIITSKKFIRYIKPKSNQLKEDSIKIHHLRECDLENACNIDDVIIELLYFIGNRKIVGYFLDFDLKMINKYLYPLIGINLPNKKYEVSEIYHDFKIDLIPQSFVDLRFKSILNELELPNFGTHDSYNDALMTALIFIKLKNCASVKIN